MAKSRRGYNFSKGHLSVIPYPIIMIASQEQPLLRLLDDLPILKANEIVDRSVKFIRVKISMQSESRMPMHRSYRSPRLQ